MSIVGTAREMPNSPEGSIQDGKASFTRRFQVQTDSYSDGPMTVLQALGLPYINSVFTFGNEGHYARCQSVAPTRLAPNSLYWEVEASYETQDPSKPEQREGQHESPLIELPDISTSFERFDKVIYSVYNTSTEEIEPCKASNGQIFDPPPTKDESRLVLTISRNEPLTAQWLPLSVIFQDAVNEDTFWGSAPGTAKVSSITAQRMTKPLQSGLPFAYLKTTYVIHFRNEGWDLQLLNHGDYYITSGENVKKIMFQGEQGQPIKGLLDENGDRLEDGADPEFLTFRVYKRLPFALMNLPSSFLDAF